MSFDKNLIPYYENIVQEATSDYKKSISKQIFSISIIEDEIRLNQFFTEEEKIKFIIGRKSQQNYNLINKLILNRLFDKLEKKHPTYITSLNQFLSFSEIINNDRLDIIAYGFQAFQNKQFISAIHILVFQIEGILRDLLEKIGLMQFSYFGDKMRRKMPSNFFSELYQIEGFDKNLLNFIDIFLFNIDCGENYRNKLAHGLLNIGDFTKEKTQLLILILIKLAPYVIQAKEKK